MEEKYIVTVEKADENFVAKNEKTKADIKAEKKLAKEDAKLEKKSESKRRKKERKEYRTNRLFLWVVVGAFLFVSASILFMNYKICFTSIGTGMPADKKAESTLLSSGLSIIGLASSVWIGLNIVQVLEKKELDALGKEVAIYRRERCELNRRNFFNNLLALDDILNRHLYKLFSEIDDVSNDLATFYFECNKIELKFHNMYKKQNRIVRNLPISYYDDALRDIERLLRDIQNKNYVNEDLFIKYLKIRLAEVYFYKGYSVGVNESIGYFNKVIDYFCEVFEELINPELIINRGTMLLGDVELTVYMFNTMGETYSKIIQGYLADEQSNREFVRDIIKKGAMFYRGLTILAEKYGKKANARKEVYYRNYGCLLERVLVFEENENSNWQKFGDLKRFKEIREQYEKAIEFVLLEDRESLREQTFYAYLSLYYKYIKSRNIKANYLDKRTEKGIAFAELEGYTLKAFSYVDIALRCFPLMVYFWKIKAFVERDCTVWAIMHDDMKKVQLHWGSFKEWCKRIEDVSEGQKVDDMRKELKESYDELNTLVEELLKKQEKN